MSTSSDPKPNSPATAATAARIVRCPSCGGDSVYAPTNAYRPFCSERCKNVDLGAWATESYRVPAAPTTEDIDDDALPPALDNAPRSAGPAIH